MKSKTLHVDKKALTSFCNSVFLKTGLNKDDSRQAAEVLVAADARGIPSHGIGRLWRYVNGLQTGLMRPDARIKTVFETPMSIVVDADGGMGAPVSVKTMKTVIEKAEKTGAAFGCVKNSNHFGIAGYYAMMALEKNMIGIAMTNTAALGVPTFGRQVMFGTNPLAFAAPAKKERGFVLDMSTTVVTRGKIEVYEREKKTLPFGWAVDKTGLPAQDAGKILLDMFHRHGGGILPLGGIGEEFGGHKGYGLAVMVDILCAVLGGSPNGTDICDTETSSARVSHFFGAIKIAAFRDPTSFRKDMDLMLEKLRECPAAKGAERVYFAGQKEFEEEDKSGKKGVPLTKISYDSISEIGLKLGLKPPTVIRNKG